MDDTLQHPLAVVPIFVNAGTALLPAVLAAMLSALAMLLRPRELVRSCRRHPRAAMVVLVLAVGLWAGLKWGPGIGRAAARQKIRTTEHPRVDWARLAIAYLNRQESSISDSSQSSGNKGDAPVVFRGGFSRTGHDGSRPPLDLKLLWDTTGRTTGMVLCSPAVRGKRIYAATAFQDIDGKTYGAVFCADAETGQIIWETQNIDGTPLKPFFSSPAISADGRYLVIGQGLHFDTDSDLLCLHAINGKLHWRIPTPLHIESSPAIQGDVVVVGAGAVEDARRRPKGHPGFVLAARISDGAELWRYQVNDPESTPAVSPEGIVYIGSGFQGNAVVALRIATDEELKTRGLQRLVWKTPLPYPVTGAVTLAANRVIVGAGNGDYVGSAEQPAGVIAALDPATGAILWQQHVEDSILGAIAADCSKVICPCRNGQVIALSLSDGKELWRQRVSGRAPVLAGPALAGGYVYAVSSDGYLAVLEAACGKLLERHMLNDPTNPENQGYSLSGPVIAAGRLYVGSETGGLRCFVGEKAGE